MVLQMMGRKIGYIPRRRDCRSRPRDADPDLHAESGLTLDNMADLVNDELKRSGRCIVR